MAIRSIAQLKKWFSRGKYPTEEQFADWIDSFVHKEEDTVPMDQVAGLPEQQNGKYPDSAGKELEREHKRLSESFEVHVEENESDFAAVHGSIEKLEAEDERQQGEIDALGMAVETETERATAEEAAIRSDFTAADATTLTAAKAYTDDRETILRGGVDEGYNTLRKLQTYIENINRAISGTETPDVIDTLNEALAFIREHQSEIESLVGTYLKKTAIADDLTTDDATRVLSARQGRELARQIKGMSDSLGTKLDASVYTAADVLAKLLTVDGHGSGLEADTVTNQKSGDALKIWQGSEAEYTAIANKDANTLYIVL